MKRTLYIAITIVLVGCTPDENPRDQIPQEEAYATKEMLFQNTVATLYNYIGGNADGEGLQGTCRGVHDLQTFGSDEAMIPTRGIDWYDGGLWQAMYKHTWNPGHELIGNSWNYLYKVITLCNISLEKLDRYEETSPYDVLYWKAEVRALRAIFYWYLIDLFGNVPIVTSTTVPINEIRQLSRADVYNFIVWELQSTLEVLMGYNSSETGTVYGRITRPVSMFVLAKLMLNAPVYTGSTNDSCYQKCIEYCDAIEAYGYKLEKEYHTNFTPFNERSTENIFTIPMDKFLYTNKFEYVYRSLHYRHAAVMGFTGENGTCATKQTLKIYGYNTDSIDIRFYHNYYSGTQYGFDGTPILDREGKPFEYVPEAVELDLSNSPYIETAGARMYKYDIDINSLKDGKMIDNDIVLFRFADVLLMRAEAKVRLGQDGQKDFDRVRERSFMRHRPCTLDNLLDERLLELSWEGWRRQDLIRFGKYKSLYDGPGKIDESDGHTTVFPIPENVITANPYLKQNKGY